MSPARTPTDREDRYGFDENSNPVTAALSKVVPQRLARAGLTVSVTTDRDRYSVGDPVQIRVDITNRLPVPVAVETPTRRLWGWRVDGELEASDEPDGLREQPGSFEFRGRETKTLQPTWNGLLKRVGGRRTRWVEPDPGVHELSAFVALSDEEPCDMVTIELA